MEKEQDRFNIVMYPHAFLKTVAKKVEVFDDDLLGIIEKMINTMRDVKGLGLAATQVGVDESILIYDTNRGKGMANPRVIINPVITECKGEIISEAESCLSVPGYYANVIRHKEITVEGQDKNGESLRTVAKGDLAVILQHEIDHLNGKIYLDRLGGLKRKMLIKSFNKKKKRGISST